ncbi:Lrp/AsnC family transcriptional regulator [Actinomadura rudentiformis]|uniref:Lrp/AsnC family transcriptional regulator n=1 Tax=Actinomadura rudentiformis TaxID=359158 RepID=A0A6H9Z5D0_9ACTN|nr:Lrp/AsnC family transcriptional regulator [Actinomadura rudentiformis]KAB2350192.1 Lrp/AsnC family transcriptional regulator [Actinomadura rudentiformis]
MSEDGAVTGGRLGHSADRLDGVDRAIIAELLRDGRISVRALAERVHISRANAYARLTRLMDDGVITGFTAELAPQKAGLGTSAYVSITIEQNSWRAVTARLQEIPYIEHFAMVGGDYDVLVLVRAPDNEALRHVVLERIQDIPGIRGTRTWLVFEEARGRGADWGAGQG